MQGIYVIKKRIPVTVISSVFSGEKNNKVAKDVLQNSKQRNNENFYFDIS